MGCVAARRSVREPRRDTGHMSCGARRGRRGKMDMIFLFAMVVRPT